MFDFDTLPPEMLYMIIAELDNHSLCQFRLVCRSFSFACDRVFAQAFMNPAKIFLSVGGLARAGRRVGQGRFGQYCRAIRFTGEENEGCNDLYSEHGSPAQVLAFSNATSHLRKVLAAFPHCETLRFKYCASPEYSDDEDWEPVPVNSLILVALNVTAEQNLPIKHLTLGDIPTLPWHFDPTEGQFSDFPASSLPTLLSRLESLSFNLVAKIDGFPVDRIAKIVAGASQIRRLHLRTPMQKGLDLLSALMQQRCHMLTNLTIIDLDSMKVTCWAIIDFLSSTVSRLESLRLANIRFVKSPRSWLRPIFHFLFCEAHALCDLKIRQRLRIEDRLSRKAFQRGIAGKFGSEVRCEWEGKTLRWIDYSDPRATNILKYLVELMSANHL